MALETVEGAKVSGSTAWYRIDVNGKTGYVHSSLVTSTPPAAPITSSGGGSSGQTSPPLQSTPAPLVEQPVAPPRGASCNGQQPADR